MKKIIHSTAFKAVLLGLALIFIAGFIFPLLIKVFFMGLLFLMQKPLTGLAIIGAFMLGMFLNEKADKIDEKINSL